MSYIVESGASTSRRARRLRALITLAIVAAMLFGSFWYAYSYYRASNKAEATPSAGCASTTAPALPKPSDITVNVFNATDRNGLAASAAAQVRKRGFTVSTVANDPLQRKIAGAAEVRFGAAGAPGAKVVATLVKGATSIKDARADSSVDLVLGEKFVALAPAAPTAPSTKVTTPPAKAPAGKTPATKAPAPKTTTTEPAC